MGTRSKIGIATGLAAAAAIVVGASSTAPVAEKKAVYGESKPLGPYTPGVDVGNMVFLAGQIGIDPADGEMAKGIEAQTRQVMNNAKTILANAGLDFGHVVKTTVFLTDIGDFGAMNDVYASFFPEGGIPPARSTVAVAALAAGAVVEIDFIAVR